MEYQEALFSGSFKNGKGSIFVDLKVAKNGREYLTISQSEFDKATDEKKRTTIRVWGEHVNDFKALMSDVPRVAEHVDTPEEKKAREKAETERQVEREIAAQKLSSGTKKYGS